jgi:hypothetical protein
MDPASLGVEPDRGPPAATNVDDASGGDVGPPWLPATVLCGLEDIPKPLLRTGRLATPGPSNMDGGLELFGVPLGVAFGVVLVLSTLDLRDDDRGVMLWLISVLTGVDRSSFRPLPRMVSGVLLRAAVRDCGGVAVK